MRQRKRIFLTYLVLLIMMVGGIFWVYTAASPTVYALTVGEISPVNIIASNGGVDQNQTQRRAEERASQVGLILTRSKSVSEQNLKRLNQVFQALDEVREKMHDASSVGDDQAADVLEQAKTIRGIVQKEIGRNLDLNVLKTYILTEKSIYESVKQKSLTFAETIMRDKNDAAEINAQVERLVTQLVNRVDVYKNEYRSISSLLKNLLLPNAVYDEEATQQAKETAYQTALQNPVIIPKGTQLVAVGDVITQDLYQQLEALNLIDKGQINQTLILSIVLLFVFCTILMALYMRHFETELLHHFKNRFAVMIIVFIPILLSGWITKMHPLVTPVYFATILLTLYFRLRTGLILSLLSNFLILPISQQPAAFLFISTFGIVLIAVITAAYARSGHYVRLILGTALLCGLPSVLYDMMNKGIQYADVATHAGVVMIASGLSAVLAIGISPMIELSLSTVSPMRLIELAQANQPLLRRLFLEAPGTYQHSMMVANLGEKAADAVGANPLLVRVGAYYHDIGKVQNPYMFTENQSDHNPHDHLPPEKSCRIIIGHVQNGLEIAKKNKLPLPIQRVIMEHHGNLVQTYFYNKAAQIAEENGSPAPDPEDFRYPWSIPTCKESAIIMLADSCEAAMKSMEIQDIEAGESLIRRIVKTKIDHDQLISSGLSFKDVEDIIQAFLQVYQGQFHKRVRYPSREDQPATTNA